MKIFMKLMNVVMIAILFVSLLAAIGSVITKEPFLLTAIRSGSMEPVWQRGDIILIEKTSENSEFQIGDIVVFKTDEGSLAEMGWIAHRIIDGNETDGYITQGDANPYTDQQFDDAGAIQKEMIAGRAFTIFGNPIIIPFVGHIPLFVENFNSSPYLLPVIALIIGGVIAFEELKGGKRKQKKRRKGLDLQMIYLLGGLTISIVIGSSMLASSQLLTLNYEVSKSLTNSDHRVIKLGEEIERPLADITNKGVFPLVGIITSNDVQLTHSVDQLLLKPGEVTEIMYNLHAQKEGSYQSSIQVGLFFPLLPPSWIYALATQNYWLALVTVSLIPGLPLMIYPVLNGQLRRKTIRELKRIIQKTMRAIPLR